MKFNENTFLGNKNPRVFWFSLKTFSATQQAEHRHHDRTRCCVQFHKLNVFVVHQALRYRSKVIYQSSNRFPLRERAIHQSVEGGRRAFNHFRSSLDTPRDALNGKGIRRVSRIIIRVYIMIAFGEDLL